VPLPLSVDIASPDRAQLRRAVRSWRAWAVTGGILVIALAGFASSRQAPGPAAGAVSVLQVTSTPAGATVDVDGEGRGRAPAGLSLAPGPHRVTLRLERYADATYRLDLEAGRAATLAAELWPLAPQVQVLRPAFPGSTIADAGFLPDGRLALTVALPPGDERQLWLTDGRGNLRRLGPPDAHGSVAAAPDGERVAYLARGPASAAEGRLDEVWITAADGERGERRYALPASATGERLFDLSWAPDGRHLLVVSRQSPAGVGQTSRLRWLDADPPATGSADPRDLVTIPSEVVRGSYVWSPTSGAFAFLARSGQLTALCMVESTGPVFRYLADVGRNDPSPLPFPPLAWSPDGARLLYAAPVEGRADPAGWLFGPRATTVLYTAEPARPLGRSLGGAEGQSPVWRGDGSLYALAQPRADGPLFLRSVDASGETRDQGPLPLRPAGGFAARWDAAHAQAVVAARGTAGADAARPEYWWLRFRPQVGE
jgi:hypothetical protein